MAPGTGLESKPVCAWADHPPGGYGHQGQFPRAFSWWLLHRINFPHSEDESSLAAACQIATRSDLHTWLKWCPFGKGLLKIYNLVHRDLKSFCWACLFQLFMWWSKTSLYSNLLVLIKLHFQTQNGTLKTSIQRTHKTALNPIKAKEILVQKKILAWQCKIKSAVYWSWMETADWLSSSSWETDCPSLSAHPCCQRSPILPSYRLRVPLVHAYTPGAAFPRRPNIRTTQHPSASAETTIKAKCPVCVKD